MAHALDPAPVTTVRAAVDVIDGDGPARGAMSVDRLDFTAQPPNATVVTDYPSEAFFSMLCDLLR